jgi:predicted RNA-binding protein with PUA domain
MADDVCECCKNTPAAACQHCTTGTPLLYWCDTCQQPVPEKRCPDCGLKSRRMRESGRP